MLRVGIWLPPRQPRCGGLARLPIYNRGRGWNRCPRREIGGVDPVRLERSLADQRVLRVPHEAGVIGADVAIGRHAASAHDEKEGGSND